MFFWSFSLSCTTGLCFPASFDIKKAVWYFDSFRPWWTQKSGRGGGGGKMKAIIEEKGVRVVEWVWWWRNLRLLNVTSGRTAGGNKKGWGRLEGQAYQCVCEYRGEQAGCLNHNRMKKESKGQDFMEMFNVHRTSRWSSNIAERLGVYRFLMKHPHSHHPLYLLTSTGLQKRRKKKSRTLLQI